MGSQTYTHAVTIDQVRVMAGGNWINSNVLAGIETLPVTVADSFEYPILANKQAAYGGVVALYPNDTQPFYLASSPPYGPGCGIASSGSLWAAPSGGTTRWMATSGASASRTVESPTA